MKYKHLSQKERDEIYALSQEGYLKTQIAQMLNRNKSTIGREIKRNATSIERRYNNSPKKKKHYLPDRAQQKYRERRRKAKTVYPLKNPFIYTYVIEHLRPPFGLGEFPRLPDDNFQCSCGKLEAWMKNIANHRIRFSIYNCTYRGSRNIDIRC